MVRSPCCDKEHTSKGAWTKEEDELLRSYIKKHGIGNWRTLPKAAGLYRCGKSCRLRWMNYLRPDVKRGNFSHDEDELVIYLHSLIGNKWSIIAARLPGRTDNEIKNHWNTHIRRKLITRGIDPKTHKPLIYSSSSSATKLITPNPKPQRSSSELLFDPNTKNNNIVSSCDHNKQAANADSSNNSVLSEEDAVVLPSREVLNLELSLSMPPLHHHHHHDRYNYCAAAAGINVEDKFKVEGSQTKKFQYDMGFLGKSLWSSGELMRAKSLCSCHKLGLQIGSGSGKCVCVSDATNASVDTMQRFSLYY